MRRLLFVVMLAACSHAKATGPAWPEPSTTADDGGESLEPHEASPVTAAIEKADEPEEKPAEEPAKDAPADATDDKPAAVTAPTQPANDDVIMSDEIIIEIDD